MRLAPCFALVILLALVVAAGCPSSKAPEPPPRPTGSEVAGQEMLDSVMSGGPATLGDEAAGGASVDQLMEQGLAAFEAGKRQPGGTGPDEERLDEAFERFSRAIDLEPGFVEAYVARGNVNLEIAQTWVMEDAERAEPALEKALADFSKALELDASIVAAHLGRAAVHRMLGDYGHATQDIQAAVELAPDDEAVKQAAKDLEEEKELFEG